MRLVHTEILVHEVDTQGNENMVSSRFIIRTLSIYVAVQKEDMIIQVLSVYNALFNNYDTLMDIVVHSNTEIVLILVSNWKRGKTLRILSAGNMT